MIARRAKREDRLRSRSKTQKPGRITNFGAGPIISPQARQQKTVRTTKNEPHRILRNRVSIIISICHTRDVLLFHSPFPPASMPTTPAQSRGRARLQQLLVHVAGWPFSHLRRQHLMRSPHSCAKALRITPQNHILASALPSSRSDTLIACPRGP